MYIYIYTYYVYIYIHIHIIYIYIYIYILCIYIYIYISCLYIFVYIYIYLVETHISKLLRSAHVGLRLSIPFSPRFPPTSSWTRPWLRPCAMPGACGPRSGAAPMSHVGWLGLPEDQEERSGCFMMFDVYIGSCRCVYRYDYKGPTILGVLRVG